MILTSDLENEIGISRLVSQADGVVVLAYPGETGGFGAGLLALLEELSGSLPVLIIQPEVSENGESACFEGAVSKVKSVSSDSGQSQNAAVMSAMSALAIKAPILILVNPEFIPFWERAFGIYRMFAVTERFRCETEKGVNVGEGESGEREKRKRILLFERSVDSVLVEVDEDLEWMRREFVYHGESYPTETFLKSAQSSFFELCKAVLSEQSRYPHRLDILILIEGLDSGQNQTADGVASLYHRGSRHHVYIGQKQSDANAGVSDFGAFDVLLIDLSDDPQVAENMGKRFSDGVKEFRGFKGFIIENGIDSDLEEIANDWGVQVLISKRDEGTWDERVSALDVLFSRFMPGLPNWQLHQAGKHLSHEAWTYAQLVKKNAAGEFSMEGGEDPIEELRMLEESKRNLESELDGMRKVIAGQDEKILVLKDKGSKLKQKTKTRDEKKCRTGFFRKMMLKFKSVR